MAAKEVIDGSKKYPCLDIKYFESVLKEKYFIDKTMLIKEIFIEKYRRVLITAPPGFGKTVNLDMIRRFAEININKENGEIGPERDSPNYKLFAKFRLISKEKSVFNNYFAKFAVIHISLKNCYGRSMRSLTKQYAEILSKTFSGHKYLLKSDKITAEDKQVFSRYISSEGLSEVDLARGISTLAKMLLKHCSNYSIFTFVDDYDDAIFKFITDTKLTTEYKNKFEIFFSNVFDNLLQTNNGINRLFITGLTTMGSSLFSNHSIKICRFLTEHELCDFYGVTCDDAATVMDKISMHLDFSPGRSTKSIETQINVPAVPFALYLITPDSHVTKDYFENIAKMVGLNNANLYPTVRIVLNNLNLKIWYPITFLTYYPKYSIRQIHNLCVSRYKTYTTTCLELLQHPSRRPIMEISNIYINLLLELGLVNFKLDLKTGHQIQATNKFVKKLFELIVTPRYEIENSCISYCKKTINVLCFDANEKYYSKFAQLLKATFTIDHLGPPIGEDIYFFLIAVITGSDYHMFVQCPNCDLTVQGISIIEKKRSFGAVIAMVYNKEVKSALEIALKNESLRNLDQIPSNQMYIGISYDESFSFKFAVLTNQSTKMDIDCARYYS